MARYIEDSGTSMAAAHVSGVIAALLSARTEYIGQPDLVKRQFTTPRATWDATSLSKALASSTSCAPYPAPKPGDSP